MSPLNLWIKENDYSLLFKSFDTFIYPRKNTNNLSFKLKWEVLILKIKKKKKVRDWIN